MKTLFGACLLGASTATPVNEEFTLLSLSSMQVESETSAENLLMLANKRNMTQMESLVQELAQETITGDGIALADDIKAALKAVRDIMSTNIEGTLLQEHKVDQDFIIEQLKCFDRCNADKKTFVDSCQEYHDQWDSHHTAHEVCRANVFALYVQKVTACNFLDNFVRDFELEPDPDEFCVYDGAYQCHTSECDATSTYCKPGLKKEFGAWLKRIITEVTIGYERWHKLHLRCKSDYHAYIEGDASCDVTQRKFEVAVCASRQCDWTACQVEYTACRARCIAEFHKTVKRVECAEKDRKIDWSAAQKVKCYINVILASPTDAELQAVCHGRTNCITFWREGEYRKCQSVCDNVDYESGGYSQHSRRAAVEGRDMTMDRDGDPRMFSQSRAGDRQLADNEVPGDTTEGVNTTHRSANGEDERRCTGHLDIDFQTIPCGEPCKHIPEAPCSKKFVEKYYKRYDGETQIADLSEDRKCHEGEHQEWWAFNRCPCRPCDGLEGGVTIPEDRYCEGSEDETVVRFKCEGTMLGAPDAIKNEMLDVCQGKVRVLRQHDFSSGTLILTEPGIYQLAEDIVFHPHGPGVDNSMMPKAGMLKYPLDNGYWLGFFAAIAIKVDGVFLDFNGKSIIQSRKHHMMQRFWTGVQLGSKPFQAKTGPPHFATSGEPVIPSNKVVIVDGTIGRSSHMGIHGNENSHIWIHNMVVNDFETGGIQLNGGKHVYISNTEVGPSYMGNQNEVPASTLSQANLLLRILELEHPHTFFTEPAFQNLVAARDAFIAGTCGEECDLFRLPVEADGNVFPDGAALYGVLFHNEQLPIHDFLSCSTAEEQEDTFNMHGPISMTDVHIHDLRLRTDEVVHTRMDGATITGPAGDVVQMLRIRDENGRYVGTVLSEAQFRLGEIASIAAKDRSIITGYDGDNVAMAADEHFALFGSTHIPAAAMRWRKHEIGMGEMFGMSPPTYVCLKDSMGHHNKGVTAVRLMSMDNVAMTNVLIENLENTGQRQAKSECFGTDVYKGNDVRGVTAILTPGFAPNGVVIRNLNAHEGCAYGIEARHKADCSPDDFEVSGITGAETYSKWFLEEQQGLDTDN